MIEEKILTDVGLTELEAKVYLAALELGPAKVVQIAKQAEVKRPTVYVILDNLTKKGFVNKIQKEKTTLYSTQQPKMILNKYKEKLANFTDLIPYFEAKFNKGPKPKIRYYEGKDEIWNVYTQILFPSDELYFFGTDVEKLNKVKSKEMSRKDFIELCLKTLKKITPDFVEGWKKLGISADYELCYSTINKNSQKLSQKSFIELLKANQIYKKEFPTLWCVECRTSIAQAELEDKNQQSLFSTIKFSSGNEEILVATTRPELLPACVAVFINPNDKN